MSLERSDPSRQSKRLQAREYADILKEHLEKQSELHASVLTELRCQKIDKNQTALLHGKLSESTDLREANNYFEMAKELGLSDTTLHDLVRELDRVSADKQRLLHELQISMQENDQIPSQEIPENTRNPSETEMKNSESAEHYSNIAENQTYRSIGYSKKSSKSIKSCSSVRSRSTSSNSSSLLRLRATKAAEDTIAAEARMQKFEIETAEEELELLERQQMLARKKRLTEKKIKADLNAARATEKLYKQACQEEDNEKDELLRPPSIPLQGDPDIHKSLSDCQQGGITEEDPKLTLLNRKPVVHSMQEEGFLHPNQKSFTSELSSTLVSSVTTAMAMQANHLPKPTIFNGNPLDYSDWRIAFESLIGSLPYTDLQKIHLLREYTDGPAREAIKGYCCLKGANVYQDALKTLEKEFGNPDIIGDTFLDKLESWPDISNGKELKKYSFFLNQCLIAMEEFPDLHILDRKRQNKRITKCLSRELGDRWIRFCTKLESQQGIFPNFKEYTDFIKYEADVMINKQRSNKSERERHGSNRTSLKTDTGKAVNNGTQNSSTSGNETLPRSKVYTNSAECMHCKINRLSTRRHLTANCWNLSKLPINEVETFIYDNSLCYACLRKGHHFGQCHSKVICKICDKSHPTVLHNKFETAAVSTEDGTKTSDTNICIKTGVSKKQVLMSMTLPVYVSSIKNPNKRILTYANLDSGSDSCYVTKDLLRKLSCEEVETDLPMSTMTNSNFTLHTTKTTDLVVKGCSGTKNIKLPTVFSIDKIPSNHETIPRVDAVARWPHLQDIAQEMSKTEPPTNVDLLIGSNCPIVFKPREVCVGSNRDDEPYGVLSDLGWTISGSLEIHDKGTCTSDTHIVNKIVHYPCNKDKVTFRCATETDKQINRIIDILEKDFKDSSSTKEGMSVEDRQFLALMQKETSLQDGHVTMPLPFRRRPLKNGSFKTAESRFNTLTKKLAKNKELSNKYHDFMNNLIKNSEAELVPKDEWDKTDSWYIPHFDVWNSKKPNKIRVVFDGSAKSDGQSLNDYLMQGPDLMNSLIGILLRFRQGQVAVTCDIERMFHQFKVAREDRDYLRFIWFDKDGNRAIFRMNVHIFGASSSPGCAGYGLKYLTTNKPTSSLSRHHEEACNFIKSNFYVDDGLLSIDEARTATNVVQEAINICKSGGLHLHKILSNNREVIESFPKSEHTNALQDLDLNCDVLPTERTLGMMWDSERDLITYHVNIADKPNTRRGVLSNVASVYDPLGLVSPVILEGRIILQEICRQKLSWDEPLDSATLIKWLSWKESLKELNQVTIPRCYKLPTFGEPVTTELHIFSDASIKGYGQCIYLRLVNSTNQVTTALVCSKARVTPLKSITIPRLELQAARGAIELSKKVEEELELNDVKKYFYTDSEVVLSYIKNTEARYHVYVANRVEIIRDGSNPDQWFHVPTAQNPADHASRGLSAKLLRSPNCNWFKGPSFLQKEPLCFPPQPSYKIRDDDLEIKKISLATNTKFHSLHERIANFSTLDRALKPLMLIQSFIQRKFDHPAAIDNRKNVLEVLIRSIQSEHFENEIKNLKVGNPVPTQSAILKLNPFLDGSGSLRVGGRLKSSTLLTFEEKHPILLPKRSHLTDLIIDHAHMKAGHTGSEYTLSTIRSQGFWIPNGKSVISKRLSQCVTCKRANAHPQVPQMATLPKCRVDESPPFTHCGLDCFGPFIVKDGRREAKRYGLIITCMSSRAVHIELLEDMSTDSFINAIRNLVAIRGPVKTIISDQGSNFVGAVKDLTKNVKGSMRIDMRFNPPHSSHMGGVWERQIRTIRKILGSIGRKHYMRFSTTTLRTIFYEIMAIINCRPLSTVTEDDLPLTPNMLLTMKSEVVLQPPGSFSDPDVYCRKRWRVVQAIANEFWVRWRKEYIYSLQTRQKWMKPSVQRVQEGDVVLLHEENVARNDWKLGRVTRCIKSHDGIVRSVELLVGSTKYPSDRKERQFLTRPVAKIITLLKSD